ncbi:hypothetical protein ACVWYH_008756 [Bradyrhizobium sp. GM24.11]
MAQHEPVGELLAGGIGNAVARGSGVIGLAFAREVDSVLQRGEVARQRRGCGLVRGLVVLLLRLALGLGMFAVPAGRSMALLARFGLMRFLRR